MTFPTSIPFAFPASASRHEVFARMKGFGRNFLYVAQGNRRPAQGCYSMTD